MFYVIAVVTVLSAAAIALPAGPQLTDRKCIPKQYEAVALGKVAEDIKGQGLVADIVANYAADYNIGRDVFIESVYVEGKFVGNYTYLRGADSDYLFDPINKGCTELPATKLEQLCTDSPSMRYLSSMSVGDQMTDTYEFMVGESKHTGTFLRSSFTLISEVTEQTFLGIPQMLAFQMGNYTMGVKDPSVFDVPSYC